MPPLTNPYLTHFRIKGVYFGYPECCIKYFMDTLHFENYTNSLIKDNYTGFIPCEKHSMQILNGEITISDIISNRICNIKFPNDDRSTRHLLHNKNRKLLMREIRNKK
jgi:hypothetical protein